MNTTNTGLRLLQDLRRSLLEPPARLRPPAASPAPAATAAGASDAVA